VKREFIGKKLEDACALDSDRALLRMFVNASGSLWLGDYLRPHAGRFSTRSRIRSLVSGDNSELVPGTLTAGGDILIYADAGVAIFASRFVRPGEREHVFVDEDLGLEPACGNCRLTWRFWRQAGVAPHDVERAVYSQFVDGGHICRALTPGAVASNLDNSIWLMSQSLKEEI
jgi:hypothetical protein